MYAVPDAAGSALEKNTAKQRGVQSQHSNAAFNLGDGPQSLIVVARASQGRRLPNIRGGSGEMTGREMRGRIAVCLLAAMNGELGKCVFAGG